MVFRVRFLQLLGAQPASSAAVIDVSSLRGMPIEVVDVFAPGPLEGNALAVVQADRMPPAELRQAIARETNLAETTFVATQPDEDGHWPVHIHTTAEELPFAGHPTLGTAWVIRERNGLEGDQVVLATGKGPVAVRFEARGPGARAWLTAPEVKLEAIDPEPWIAALGLAAGDADDARFPCSLVDVGPRFAVLAVAERARLAALYPDGVALQAQLERRRATGVLIVSPAGPGEGDLAARMFFEAGGVREDPATGSANAGLAALLQSVGVTGRVDVTQGVEMQRTSKLSLEIASAWIEVGGAVWPAYAGHLFC